MLLSTIATAPAQAAADPRSLLEALAQFANSNNPTLSLRMFHLTDSCVRFKRGEAMSTFDTATNHMRAMTELELAAKSTECAGLTDDIAAARFGHLDAALKGQAPGAAAAFVILGPDGDSSAVDTRTSADPRVLAWKKQAASHLTESALRGDMMSMIYLQSQQDQPERLGITLTMAYAADAAMRRLVQQGSGDLFLIAAKHLSREQLAAAKAYADQMVDAHNQQRAAPPAAVAR